uniref:Reverse transcriptase domain-containing protein n=1 Tax=Tanacetum cinerariifolium TaxID=118510 RepID=A0A6L2L7R0_TANCI|nr:reverse transcriptase domain-containing protein [Tanacetum cinerariifolium]
MYARTKSEILEPKSGRSKSPREKGLERRAMFKRLEKCVFYRLGDKEKNVSAHSRGSERKSYNMSESEGSAGGHRKSKPNKQKSSMEDDLSQPWKKGIKDPVGIHNIKQRNRESMEEFVRRYKLECRDVKGGDSSLQSRTEKAVSTLETGNQTKAKLQKGKLLEGTKDGTKTRQIHPSYKNTKRTSCLRQGKFKSPPPMTTPVEKRNASKFCKFHGRKDQAKIAKKGETSGKDKLLAILMVKPWKRITRQRITQIFSPESVISFLTIGEEDGTEGPMIIEAEMRGHCVHRIYVDGGSSLEILYEYCFSKFHPEIMIPVNTPLVEFSEEIIWPIWQISLLVRIGDEEHSMSAWMNFMVVRSPSSYNGIKGRPRVRKIRAIPSTAHGMIKFLVAGGIVTLQSSRIIPLECSMISKPGEGRKDLGGLLRSHIDVFAWKPADISGVPRHIAEHRLNIREGCLPIRQKKKGQAPERNEAISKEVKKLVEADIMKEFHFDNWLSNPLMCKKKSDFQWTPEAEGAFKEMKQSIAELSMLTAPKEKEELIMYLAASKEAISAVLMTGRDGKQVTGRLLKWSFELGEHDIQYRPRTSVKGQILADFIVERLEDDEPDTPMEDREDLLDPWILFRFNATNNEAKKEALIAGLRIAREKAIDEKEILAVVEEEKGHTWMTPFYEYLTEGILLEEKRKQGLYAENYVLREIHGGSCSMHARPSSVAEKALSLDLLEKKREQAAIQEATNKAKMEGYYNVRVRSTSFRPGDFVYLSNEASHAKDECKLEPKWEGPYEVKKALGKGAYKLRDHNGHTFLRTWNICNLKKCYMHEM